MLSNIKYYVRPSSIQEAIEELSKGKGKYIIYAGGTSTTLMKNNRIEGFVSLRDLKLSYIKKCNTGVKIGAMTRIQELYESDIIKNFAKGIIHKAVSKIGSTLNRNLITTGGNITQIFRWSDLPVALLVLNTKINIQGKSKRSINVEDFYKKHPKTILNYDDIVVDVKINEPKGSYGVDFIKFSKTEFDYALIDVAMFLSVSNNKIKDIKIAYGGVKTFPFRAYELEEKLKNRVIDKNLEEKIKELSKEYINPVSDFRVSKEYQKEITGVITQRAFNNCLKSIK